MTLSLKEYIETIRVPQLSYHVKYSELFEIQYARFNNELIGVVIQDKPIYYYCWKDEFKEFDKLLDAKKLFYKDAIIGENGNSDYLIEYSQYFEKGFNSVDYNTPASVIINNVPFCSTQKCINPNYDGNIIALGRKNSNSIPCIAGNRPMSFESLFGQGLLHSIKINNVTEERTLQNPLKTAFNEGVMFKSIFLVIERYVEFEKYFLDKISRDENFIDILLNGIRELQTQDINAECIRELKVNNKHDEALFRNWFKTYFSGKYQTVNAEPQKSNGRIDLKIQDSCMPTKIIEFKGWWNDDKKNVVKQLNSYLTDFENEGFIVLINHSKRKNITNEYISLVTKSEMDYVEKTLKKSKFSNTGFEYFVTQHSDSIRTKTLNHFILNVY